MLLSKQKTLLLTLHKLPYEVMVTGEKTTEYRQPSKWILSRLQNKDGTPKQIDKVRFGNGYTRTCPLFEADFLGFEVVTESAEKTYSNGLIVLVEVGDIAIHFKNPQVIR